MAPWILIIIMSASGTARSPAITHIEMPTEQVCKRAIGDIAMEGEKIKDASGQYRPPYAFCIRRMP